MVKGNGAQAREAFIKWDSVNGARLVLDENEWRLMKGVFECR